MGHWALRKGIKIRCVLFLLFTVVGTEAWALNGNDDDFEALCSVYERRMNMAAQSWHAGHYMRALDLFYSARNHLSMHLPSPSDAFLWHGITAMKTYSLLLARLAEAESSEKSGKKALEIQLKQQAFNWSSRLTAQVEKWEQSMPLSKDQTAFREKWIRRFMAAIHQARSEYDSN